MKKTVYITLQWNQKFVCLIPRAKWQQSGQGKAPASWAHCRTTGWWWACGRLLSKNPEFKRARRYCEVIPSDASSQNEPENGVMESIRRQFCSEHSFWWLTHDMKHYI